MQWLLAGTAQPPQQRPERRSASRQPPVPRTTKDELLPEEPLSPEAWPPLDQRAASRQWQAPREAPAAEMPVETARQRQREPGAAAEQSYAARAWALRRPEQAARSQRAAWRPPLASQELPPRVQPVSPRLDAPCGRALPALDAPATAWRCRRACAPATSRFSVSLPAQISQPRCCRRVRAGYARAHARLHPSRSSSSGSSFPSRRLRSEHRESLCSSLPARALIH